MNLGAEALRQFGESPGGRGVRRDFEAESQIGVEA